MNEEAAALHHHELCACSETHLPAAGKFLSACKSREFLHSALFLRNVWRRPSGTKSASLSKRVSGELYVCVCVRSVISVRAESHFSSQLFSLGLSRLLSLLAQTFYQPFCCWNITCCSSVCETTMSEGAVPGRTCVCVCARLSF
jgi:hypothetical protein